MTGWVQQEIDTENWCPIQVGRWASVSEGLWKAEGEIYRAEPWVTARELHAVAGSARGLWLLGFDALAGAFRMPRLESYIGPPKVELVAPLLTTFVSTSRNADGPVVANNSCTLRRLDGSSRFAAEMRLQTYHTSGDVEHVGKDLRTLSAIRLKTRSRNIESLRLFRLDDASLLSNKLRQLYLVCGLTSAILDACDALGVETLVTGEIDASLHFHDYWATAKEIRVENALPIIQQRHFAVEVLESVKCESEVVDLLVSERSRFPRLRTLLIHNFVSAERYRNAAASGIRILHPLHRDGILPLSHRDTEDPFGLFDS